MRRLYGNLKQTSTYLAIFPFSFASGKYLIQCLAYVRKNKTSSHKEVIEVTT